VKVRISFTAPDHVHLFDPAADPRILPDMGVKVTFLEDTDRSKKKEDKSAAVALVPQKAVRQDNSSKYVLLVKDGVLERRAVTVGSERGSDIEILAGLQPDQTIVVGGPDSLRDGQSVQIKQ
jgi:hypothetical protein